jgi:hypothetical protein
LIAQSTVHQSTALLLLSCVKADSIHASFANVTHFNNNDRNSNDRNSYGKDKDNNGKDNGITIAVSTMARHFSQAPQCTPSTTQIDCQLHTVILLVHKHTCARTAENNLTD